MTAKSAWFISTIVAGALLNPSIVSGYEIETHADMSRAAANASVLVTDATILQNLGIKSSDEFPNSKNNDQPKSIVELIRDGARFEDDGLRPRNHFYDPLTGLGLQGVSIPFFTIYASPDWALANTRTISDQQFSFVDARSYLYQALTATNQADHDKYFGLTFQTLGQVIHHIQDMAQPQHVRNDVHCDNVLCYLIRLKKNTSRYEKYTDLPGIRNSLPFGGYPAVTMDATRNYWHTPDGQGIADYTNRGFVSAGTNFDTTTYSSPNAASAIAHDENANTLLQQAGLPIPPECQPPASPCTMTFYRTTVHDSYLSADETNDRTSTWSIFDQDLKVVGKPVYSLNRFNFYTEYPLLISKAVGYSAGLINYFFRGKLEAQNASFSDDGTNLTVTLQIKNAIDPNDTAKWNADALYAASGQTPSSFTLTVHYALNGQDRYAVSDPIPIDSNQDPSIFPGQVSNQSFTFKLPSVPAAATNVQFRVVFRGKLGEEDGVVAVGRAEPVSGFVFLPSYLPADGIEGRRVIEKRGGAWRLSSRTGLQAGNIDWKGGYVGDMSTKVLSWAGPPSRYFPIGNRRPFDIAIYQNGQVFAYAPFPVLGAAITKDAAGREWLVAICADGSNDVVYRRPNQQSDSSDLYDPVSNPDGWLEIGRFSPPSGMSAPDRPWFFNGTGTEAQTMRPDNSVLSNGLTRIKLTLDPASLTVTAFEPMANLAGDTLTEYSTPSNWTINPPPTLPPCTPGAMYTYSDSTHGEITYGNTDTGEYIVAVDYTASGEITATYRINGTATTTETYDQKEQGATNCGPPETSSGSSTAEAASRATEHWQASLAFGTTTVILTTQDRTAARIQNYQSSYVSGSPPQYSSHYDYNEHIKSRPANIVSLDLRHGLVVVSSETFDNTYTASGSDATAPINGQSTLARATDILTATQPVPVYRDEQSSSWTVPGSGGPFLTRLGAVGSVVPGYEKTSGPSARYPSLDPIEGSWAINTAGDLFVSQLDWDINLNNIGNWFSYFSGGDLKQLVPPAPPNANYVQIGVIH